MVCEEEWYGMKDAVGMYVATGRHGKITKEDVRKMGSEEQE